jgi:hypothetical protein
MGRSPPSRRGQSLSAEDRRAKLEELRELLRRKSHGAAPIEGEGLEAFDEADGPRAAALPLDRGTLGVISGDWSSGKTSLALSRLAAVTRAGQRVALVDGTGWVYPPALALMGGDLEKILVIQPPEDRSVWAAEQVLRSGLFVLVVLLEPRRLDRAALRRLQLAAERGRSCGLLVPRDDAAVLPGMISMRLRVTAIPPEPVHPMPIAAPPRRCQVRTVRQRGHSSGAAADGERDGERDDVRAPISTKR